MISQLERAGRNRGRGLTAPAKGRVMPEAGVLALPAPVHPASAQPASLRAGARIWRIMRARPAVSGWSDVDALAPGLAVSIGGRPRRPRPRCSSGMNGRRAAGRKTCVLNCCWTIEPLPCWRAVNPITCCIPPGRRPPATSRGVMPVRCRCARPRRPRPRDMGARPRGSCRIPCRSGRGSSLDAPHAHGAMRSQAGNRSRRVP